MTRNTHFTQRIGIVLLLLAGFASGCTSAPTPTITPTSSHTPTFTPSLTWTPSPTVTFTPSMTPTATFTPTATQTPTPTVLPTMMAPPTLVPSPTGLPPSITPTPRPTIKPTAKPHIPTGANLLENGGFEDAAHYEHGAPEVSVPNGWTAWWYQGPTEHDEKNPIGYVRPEMKVIDNIPPFTDPPRVREGNKAAMFFGSHKCVDAGYWQQVQIEQGRTLHLSGWGHAWSTTGDDPRNSELNSPDDRINAEFRLGIDPTGGTSAFAPTVIWGDGAHIYDIYGPIPSLEVTAENSTITVFVQGRALWPFKHNDFYFDSIHLEYSD